MAISWWLSSDFIIDLRHARVLDRERIRTKITLRLEWLTYCDESDVVPARTPLIGLTEPLQLRRRCHRSGAVVAIREPGGVPSHKRPSERIVAMATVEETNYTQIGALVQIFWHP